MIGFYDVDVQYINFLKQFDSKVPNISYSGNNKFVCGVVFSLNGIDYFAPVSHNTNVFQTSFPIYDNQTIISTVRLSFMFPATNNVLSRKDFSVIRATNPNYANLLEKEWKYCANNEMLLKKKAGAVYKIGCNANHRLNSNCCNFKLLESKYLSYPGI